MTLGNKIRANRRATLSPALSRRTGEGGGLQVKTRSSENFEIWVLKKLVPDFFRRPFTQSKQTCDNSSSVGFAREPAVRQSELGVIFIFISWQRPRYGSSEKTLAFCFNQVFAKLSMFGKQTPSHSIRYRKRSSENPVSGFQTTFALPSNRLYNGITIGSRHLRSRRSGRASCR